MQAAIKNVTVVGAGLMGSGIAQVAAQNKYNVVIVDTSNAALDKSLARIETNLQKTAQKKYAADKKAADGFVETTLSRIVTLVDPEKAVEDADLVIEAIVENLNLKQQLFSRLDSVAPKKTIFATNTSSLPVKEIAETTRRKDRFGGLHFFYPVQIMKLIEVIRIQETSDETFNALFEFGNGVGKSPIVCQDSAGFVVNRLLYPYTSEALKMLERGDASARDIDTAMKLGASYPMGPFELLDFLGLDTYKFIMDGLHAREPNNEYFKPSKILEDLIKQGKFGVKTGEGFYTYKK